jgi:hypothetical protein
MISKKVLLSVFFLVFVSFCLVAQKPSTPLVKGLPKEQQKVNPGGTQDPSTHTGAPVVSVKTSPVKNITQTSAETGYTLTITSGNVLKHGICLGRMPNPTTSGAIYAADKTNQYDFTVQLTSLAPATTFYIRSFATTSAGTVYGNEISFSTMKVNK